MKIGKFDLRVVSDGTFSLDGGAMFGIVPRPVWSKVYPPDEKNRIRLGLNPLLISTGDKHILVDTGIGNKFDEQFASMYAVDHSVNLFASLAEARVKPEDIDYVIPTHLHFDHMGGATVKQGGEIVPAFPNATYIIQEKEFELAHDENPRVKGSYIRDNYVPLQKGNRIKLINGDEQVVPGVIIRKTSGHTWGHQIVQVVSDGKSAAYLGDLLPTSAHQKTAWCMGYDLDPLAVANMKDRILKEAFETGMILVLDHHLGNPFFKVVRSEKGFALEQLQH